MIMRFLYAIHMAYHYRQALRLYTQAACRDRVTNLTEITLAWLQQRGIETLVLDFDGVLAEHGATKPLPEIETWLNHIYAVIPLYVLSNKPLPARKLYFQTRYPNLTWVAAPRKKPYPDGLIQITKLTSKPSNTIALVDDRLLTGILATKLANTQGIYVTHPCANFKKRPLTESFFAMLRFLERWVFV